MAARTFDKSNITLSAVVAAPAGWPLPVGNKNWTDGHFDLKATVKYGTKLIAEARGNGADLVAFPELWFPGYPKSLEAKWMFPLVEEYVANSLVVDSDEWKALRDAARENTIYVSFGFSERAGDFIYMSQALFGPEGEVLINRRKLRPSGTERGLWSDGSDDGLMVVDTKIGRVGMLQCWEHLRPTMTFNIQAQLPNIHVGAWPYNQNPGAADVENWEDVDVAYSALRLLSILTNAVTVTPSIGYGFINQFTTLLAHSNSNATAHPNDDQDYAPLIYSSVNGSSWSNQSYDLDGEVSWGTLKQIEDGFPEYIPKENGSFVTFRQYSTDAIIENSLSGNASETVEPPSTSVATGTLLATATSVPTGTVSSGAASAGMPAAAPAVLQLAAALVTVVCYL
ncbi:Arylacetonitrilase, partial [Colletotrichum shisoi]